MTHEHSVTGGRYDTNVTRLINDYPDFAIRGGFEGVGYQAQQRRMALPRGSAIAALTLDELAGQMDEIRAAARRPRGCDDCHGGLVAVAGCTCAAPGPDGPHEPLCGYEKCPRGCRDLPHPADPPRQ
jgi:hypothetical protein